ncbi:hypothetical protein KFL_002970090 [Klebsormidium nitens]|uniref:Uncharacterized protein n=1 Tax=Klebsormidium nitens TaxID=105231 RepID=A0A1Y1IBV3_KLENI|nr:hypothetical protein KFL_002970090 [Klebsormidium nitens]|eukprot:GAQ86571.1 hypothetical protein KFL_002970090 [Klebsormidium nitens]
MARIKRRDPPAPANGSGDKSNVVKAAQEPSDSGPAEAASKRRKGSGEPYIGTTGEDLPLAEPKDEEGKEDVKEEQTARHTANSKQEKEGGRRTRDSETTDSTPEYGPERKRKGAECKVEPVEGCVRVNRAPVLALWVAVVAQREGYTWPESLSFGMYIAGLFAVSKARHLGIVRRRARVDRTRRQQEMMHLGRCPVFGIQIYVKKTPGGLRAIGPDGRPIEPDDVMQYLRRKFGDKLELVKKAMESLACVYSPNEIGEVAYDLYEKFRPPVPPGRSGFGTKGPLDLAYISKTLVEEARKAKGKANA